ncbi:MAG: ParB N-terminal domain-containing protein [Pseudomonadota bacterium]
MKRSIPKSLVQRALDQSKSSEDAGIPADLETKSAVPMKGAGSAWKAGALAQSQSAVQEAREALAKDVLNGRHEVVLDPGQVDDPLGSDRRDDWRDQPAFRSLVESIAANGQDTPIVVWPKDPNWTPDPLDPTRVTGVAFMLLTGRRRHAAAAELGAELRAILAPPDLRVGEKTQFEMLFLRFRENEAREDLSAFERLHSIGEMYEELQRTEGKITAVAFAQRIGVHESVVSRARTVFARRDEILNAFKNAYDMSFGDLQKAIATLGQTQKTPKKPAVKALTAKRKLGRRNLVLTQSNGNLAIKASGIPVDQKDLDALGDLIADFLNRTTQREEGESPRISTL